MFCADYIAAFVYHAILTIGTIHVFGRSHNAKLEGIENDGDDSNNKENTDTIDKRGKKVLAIQLASHGLGLSYNNRTFESVWIKENRKNCDVMQEENDHVKSRLFQTSNSEMSQSLWIPLCFGLASGLAASTSLYPFDFVRGGVLTPGLKRIMSAGSTVPYAGVLFGMYFNFRDPNNISSQIRWAAGASTCAILAEVPFDHAKRAMLGSTRIMLGAGLLYVPFATLMLVMYDKAAVNIVTPIITLNEQK